ncbi:hypothetical protein ACQ4PT_068238 [Festuca glaucescens]
METEVSVSLPEDVLADILNRLRPRDLARCRRVCRPWCDLVDACDLLLRHALPHSVDGFFLNYIDYRRPHYLARPLSAGPHMDGRLSFLPDVDRKWTWSSARDHHNGLILYTNHYDDRELLVVNPTTRQWAALLPLVKARTWAGYIVFEPAVSPHYEVFLIPPLPKGDPETDDEHEDDRYAKTDDEHEDDPYLEGDDENEGETYAKTDDEHENDLYRLMEWPPSTCVLQFFSSKTGHWEERSFVREGEAAGYVADLRRETNPLRHIWRHAVHLHGTLYVQSLVENKHIVPVRLGL